MVIRTVAIACAVAACTSATVTIEPIVDLPDNASASPFPLDSLRLEVAHEGSDGDLQSAMVAAGQGTPEVEGVQFADDLVVHLTGTEAGSPSAYGRTCAFAATGTDVPSPHLLFSKSKWFADLSYPPEGMPILRRDGIGITYHDGTGLLLGGVNPNDGMFVSAIEQLDASGFTLQRVDVQPLSARTGAVVAALGAPTPQLVVIGGFDLGTSATATYIETITLESASVTTISDMSMGSAATREELTATALPSENAPIVLIGGRTSTGPSSAISLIEAKPAVTIDDVTASLATARYGHTSTLLGPGAGAPVLVAGGADASGNAIATAELYKPLSNAVSTSFSQKMLYPRVHHHAALMPDGSVVFIGGFQDAMDTMPITVVERFTIDGGFNDAGKACSADSDCPDSKCGAGTPTQCVLDLATTVPKQPPFGIFGVAITALPDGCLLLTGGSPTPGAPPVATAYKLCVNTADQGQDFIEYPAPTTAMMTARAFHQSTLLCDGTVMVSGGTTGVTGDTTAQAEIERYNPDFEGRR